jgi:hypothetical protein
MYRSMPSLFAVVLLVLSLTASGCDLIGDGSDARPNVLVPLAEGNFWAYSGYYLEPSLSDSFRVEITREVPITFNDTTYQAFARTVRRESGSAPPSDEELYWNGPDGVYGLGGLADTDTLLFKHMRRRFPARPGDSWTFVRLGFRSSTERFTITDTLTVSLEATDEPLETPAGTFDCHVYTYTFRPAEDVAAVWDVFEYYAPGVGLVGEIVRSRLGDEILGVKQKTLLYDYRVN